MHKAVKNLTDTGVNIKSGSNTEVYLISEILLNQVWQLKQLWLSLREIVSAVESGVVRGVFQKGKRYFLGIFPERGGGWGHPNSQNFCKITKSFLACQIHPKVLKHVFHTGGSNI